MVSVAVAAFACWSLVTSASCFSPWSFATSFGRPDIEFVEIGVLQGVLVLGPAETAADLDVLRDLEIEIGALDGGELGAQPGDDLVGARRRAAPRGFRVMKKVPVLKAEEPAV